VNLASFAELTVRLVNSAVCDDGADPLRSRETFRDFVADRPLLAVPVDQHDLDRLRLLRAELKAIFALAAGGAGQVAVDRLNNLLMIHPAHAFIVSHGSERWHLHLSESGSVTDRYAAAAASSLAVVVTQLGPERLGICAIAACDRVFIDGSSNRSRRYCSVHSAARGNVTSLPRQGRGITAVAAETAESAAS
jgi:predicted RNA-binding Zn ribbon-like protein